MVLNGVILIKTRPIDADEVVARTRKLNGVRKVFQAYGRFDLVAFVEAADYAAVKNLTGEINSVDGVRSTETLVEA